MPLYDCTENSKTEKKEGKNKGLKGLDIFQCRYIRMYQCRGEEKGRPKKKKRESVKSSSTTFRYLLEESKVVLAFFLFFSALTQSLPLSHDELHSTEFQ